MRLGFSSLYLFLALAVFGASMPVKLYGASPSSISVSLSPSNPAPNQKVNITLTSYLSNLDSVLITWSVDGRRISAEVGQKSFSVTAPQAGQSLQVTAVVSLPDGNVEKGIIIRPAIMALLWQANDSYVPPFYKGKALPTPDSSVTVVAMPEIRNGTQTVNAKNLVYTWKRDYVNEPSASGYGKYSYSFLNNYLEDSNNISVVASTTDQTSSSRASLDIPTWEPKILFYKRDLELGTLWEQTLSNNHIIQGEEILEAAPYYISPRDIRIPTLTWAWSINGRFVSVFDEIWQNLLPVRAQAGASGTSKIELEINNKYKLFQNTKATINVTF